MISPNFAYGVSVALFVVWMQRHGRWALFWHAVQGNVTINGALRTNQSGTNPVNSLVNISATGISGV